MRMALALMSHIASTWTQRARVVQMIVSFLKVFLHRGLIGAVRFKNDLFKTTLIIVSLFSVIIIFGLVTISRVH